MPAFLLHCCLRWRPADSAALGCLVLRLLCSSAAMHVRRLEGWASGGRQHVRSLHKRSQGNCVRQSSPLCLHVHLLEGLSSLKPSAAQRPLVRST